METQNTASQGRFYNRSLFWPLMLISVGLIWLLTNIGVLSALNIQALFRLWPLILIVIGLDLLVGRGNPRLKTIIGVGGVGLILALMLIAPALGLVRGAELKEGHFDEPLGDAVSARVNLSLAVADTHMKALSDSDNLFEGDLRYLGDINFTVSGQSEKIVTLDNEDTPTSFSFWDFGLFNNNQNPRWDIGLSKNVPVYLDIQAGVGSSTLDLHEVQITGVQISGGVGQLDLDLPSMDTAYSVQIQTGTGSAAIRIEEGAAIEFNIQGGVGSVDLDVPEGAAVKVDAETGVGSIHLPASYTRLNGDENQFVGENGVWQSPDFADAARQIIIHYQGGVGSLTVK